MGYKDKVNIITNLMGDEGALILDGLLLLQRVDITAIEQLKPDETERFKQLSEHANKIDILLKRLTDRQ